MKERTSERAKNEQAKNERAKERKNERTSERTNESKNEHIKTNILIRLIFPYSHQLLVLGQLHCDWLYINRISLISKSILNQLSWNFTSIYIFS